MDIPSSTPQTPTSTRSEEFNAIIADLNHTFNLGIVVPDTSLTPLQRKEEAKKAGVVVQRVDKIRSRLRRQFFQSEAVLDGILARFRSDARDLCTGAASTAEEVDQLHELLWRLVNDPPPETQSFQEVMTDSETPSSRRSPKRRSDDKYPGDSLKKSKRAPVIDDSPLPRPVWTNVLSLRSTAATATAVKSQASTSPQRPELPSASTSMSTMAPETVFSQPEDEDQESSQSTIEAGPEERWRPGEDELASSPSSPYDPDDVFVQAMADAFSQSFQEALPNAENATTLAQQALEDRLRNTWPPLPPFLNHAPLGICWEVTRIALSCKVSLNALKDVRYSDTWHDQTKLRLALCSHPSFAEKTLPERSDEDAWKASLSTFQEADGKAISLAVNLSWSPNSAGPLFDVALQPLKLDQSHRLGRRFGADRFLDLNVPSPTDKKERPQCLNKVEGAADIIIKWISMGQHFLVGRKWAAFFTRAWQKKEKDQHSEAERTFRFERVYCFAEDGNSFTPGKGVPSKAEATMHGRRNKMRLSEMLDWMLSTSHPKNRAQPAVKLFSRMALSLSKTWGAVVIEPGQIRCQQADILSPAGHIMNDGIARMSTALARRISENMGLTDVPSAFQGRFGSAKGLWIRDTTDVSDAVWIETFPSQRKWECDLADDDHRAFEVKSYSRMPRPADVNMQFIIVLCAQARDPAEMRRVMAGFMETWLEQELRKQRSAMDDPVEFYQWNHENFFQAYRSDHMSIKGVEFLGGMPNRDAEIVNFLLAGGFHPMELAYLNSICWRLAQQKCQRLKETLRLRIPRSTYAFMAVDFQGVLRPGEVHFGFSSKFQVDACPETLLHGVDVLVARAPAHYPSDIQRVRAVFRPELAMLKDVIIFPSTGDVPLADLLSGGDYDGDQAWVCWEPSIVDNFRNASTPEPPDFAGMGFLRKEKGTFADVLTAEGGDPEAAVARFVFDGFRFNMSEQLLGACTKHKEKFCYKTQRIDDEPALALSGLLSALVDQAKQGIIFTQDDWRRFKVRYGLSPRGLYNPAYWPVKPSGARDPGTSRPTGHVLDFLKFDVAIPKVDRELKEFKASMGKPYAWDESLAGPAKELDSAIESTGSPQLRSIRTSLNEELTALYNTWGRRMGDRRTAHCFEEKVRALYDAWVAIRPPVAARTSPHGRLFLGPDSDADSTQVGRWAMVKASATFRAYYDRNERFTWTMAGRQLQRIKATASGAGSVSVVMPLYAVLRPDGGLVAGVAAARAGREDGSIVGEVDWDETGTQIDDV